MIAVNRVCCEGAYGGSMVVSSETSMRWLQSFVQPEKLDSAEAWYCPKCKEHVQVSVCTSCFQMTPGSLTP
jgi:hypothetical protein